MPPNRRNHYRILHVQPDAPAEVIKAAYRTLVSTLRHHPDLGGDHETAALINEAYAVLSDPARRTAYDAGRGAKGRRSAPHTEGRHPRRPPSDPAHPCCPFCGAGIARLLPVNARCATCRAPLTAVASPRGGASDTERRGMPRVSKSDWAVIYLHYRVDGVDVRLRDLSLDGISIYAGGALPVGQRVRIVGTMVDVVADIVSCRRAGSVFTVHAHLITAQFAHRSGLFVSTSA